MCVIIHSEERFSNDTPVWYDDLISACFLWVNICHSISCLDIAATLQLPHTSTINVGLLLTCSHISNHTSRSHSYFEITCRRLLFSHLWSQFSLQGFTVEIKIDFVVTSNSVFYFFSYVLPFDLSACLRRFIIATIITKWIIIKWSSVYYSELAFLKPNSNLNSFIEMNLCETHTGTENKQWALVSFFIYGREPSIPDKTWSSILYIVQKRVSKPELIQPHAVSSEVTLKSRVSAALQDSMMSLFWDGRFLYIMCIRVGFVRPRGLSEQV